MVAAQRWQQQASVAARRDVRVAFFKFGKNGVGAEAAGIVGSQGRDEFSYDDLEAYFNYSECAQWF